MGRGRDFRGGASGKRRDYEDGEPIFTADYHGPELILHKSKPSRGPAVDAVVKWFKPEKGFGFVEVLDGSGDAFLHTKVLQALGPDAVSAGARLTVVIDEGQRGRHVSQVIAIHSSTLDPYSVTRNGAQEPRTDTGVEIPGIVKWFSETKGMGFIADESGGEDVFVHVTTLRAARLSSVAEGQHVLIKVIETDKGRKATSIALAD